MNRSGRNLFKNNVIFVLTLASPSWCTAHACCFFPAGVSREGLRHPQPSSRYQYHFSLLHKTFLCPCCLVYMDRIDGLRKMLIKKLFSWLLLTKHMQMLSTTCPLIQHFVFRLQAKCCYNTFNRLKKT